MSRIGAMEVDDTTGRITTQAVGDQALAAAAAHGTRVQVAVSATGARQIDLVPNSIDASYLRLSTGRKRGQALVASDVDPGGIGAIQNTSGVDLYLERVILQITTATAGACTADVGISANPIPAGGEDNIFDGINLNTLQDFDSLWAADHPGAVGRPGMVWRNNEWLSITRRTGASAGLVGRLIFEVVEHGALVV